MIGTANGWAIFEAAVDDVKIQTRCGECATLLAEGPDIPPEERSPCPLCGSPTRRIQVETTARVSIASSLRTRARHETGSWFHEQQVGKDYSVRAARWMDKVRRIDRDDDRYDEVVTDPETGEVVHETHEPLSKHLGPPIAGDQLTDLDHFLTARWVLYSGLGRVRAAILTEHPRWRFRQVTVTRLAQSITTEAGLAAATEAPLAHFSDGVDARLAWPRITLVGS